MRLDWETEARWETVLQRLLAAPRTREELRRKLAERGCPSAVSEALLDRCEKNGAVDDRAYALLFVDAKRDFGERRIRDELRMRGVADDDIDAALDEADFDEYSRAADYARSQWRNIGMTERKLFGRMARRGFSSDAIRAAIDEMRDEYGEDEEDDE